MSFVRKFSGDRTMPIVAVYTCAVHGEFDAEVERDENGEAPDAIWCPFDLGLCGLNGNKATWTPSPVGCRVRRVEAVKGRWEPPARKTFLDTRELAEGQDIEEFRAKRAEIWDEKRKAEVMQIKRGFE